MDPVIALNTPKIPLVLLASLACLLCPPQEKDEKTALCRRRGSGGSETLFRLVNG